MNTQPEILQALQEQAQVDPEFTSVVWQKLEEQNPSFFRAYNVQLQLKEQILAFNYLVRVPWSLSIMSEASWSLTLPLSYSGEPT